MTGLLNLGSLLLGLIAWRMPVNMEDWSVLMETTYATASVVEVLLVVTILLNAIMLILYGDSTAK
ncbi:hypothetical protein [Psychrobacillus sp. NPDC093180]|uniref:hypothetical protein n=1 Tax=Psychrobacillus sp. NPDC093180 TaxID=3364489 RepID=UPI0037F8D024